MADPTSGTEALPDPPLQLDVCVAHLLVADAGSCPTCNGDRHLVRYDLVTTAERGLADWKTRAASFMSARDVLAERVEELEAENG